MALGIIPPIARLLQTPGADDIAPKAFLGGGIGTLTDRPALDSTQPARTAELPAIIFERSTSVLHKSLKLLATPGPGAPAGPVLVAVSAGLGLAANTVPAQQTAPVADLPAPTEAALNRPAPINTPGIQLSQFSPQTRPSWMGQKSAASAAAIAVPRSAQPDVLKLESGHKANHKSRHHAETWLPATAPNTAQTAIALAAPTPANPALPLAAFSVEPGQLPGLVLVPLLAEAPQSGATLPAGQPTATPAPVAAMHAIAKAASALQNRPVELTLHPRELGRVRLTLQAVDGSMAVAIAVERPETLDLLRRHIDQLANQLRDIGYQNLTFEFAAQDQQFGHRERGFADTQRLAEDANQPSTQPPEPLRLLIGGDAGVDIRV